MNITQKLYQDLVAFGIEKGMVLMVHSSLKSLKDNSITPNDVIDALLMAVGEEGTLLMPALSYKTVTKDTPVFSYNDTPCCVGIIPETFRKRDGVIRSMNPVHSVCAYGKLAMELTQTHFKDKISIGENSPYIKMLRYNAKILMIGCGLKPNTFMHGIENAAGAPYREIKLWIDYQMTDKDANEYIYSGGLPDMRMYEQCYDRIEQILLPKELIKGNLLGAEAWLIDSQPLFEKASAKIKESPYFFVKPLS